MINTKITKCEIVPATYDSKAFEIKVFHADGSWQYFSRGFATYKDAMAVVKKLLPQEAR